MQRRSLLQTVRTATGAGGGNMSLELRSALQDITDSTHPIRVLTRIYGLGGKDFFVEDAVAAVS